MTEQIQLRPYDHTINPSDSQTRERIVQAFAAAGASRYHWDEVECGCEDNDFIGWGPFDEVIGCTGQMGRYLGLSEVLAASEPQPDYRDGQWWPWIGGECPVDPDDEVVLRLRDPADLGDSTPHDAKGFNWQWDYASYDIIAFRVTQRAPDERERLVERVKNSVMGCGGVRPYKAREVAERLHRNGFLRDPENNHE